MDGPFVLDTGNPAPAGLEAVPMAAADGWRLRGAFAPPAAPVQGTILLLQGRSEYLEKYFETMRDLTARGFAVLTFDWRGQGGSGRLAPDSLVGHVPSFDAYGADAGAALAVMAARALPKPWHIVAHSMGGAAALHLLAARGEAFAKAVLTAPMVDVLTGGIPPLAAKLMAGAGVRAGLGGAPLPRGSGAHPADETFGIQRVTRDEQRFLRNVSVLHARPDLGIGRPSFGWLAASYRAMDRLRDPAFLARVRNPVLIVSAGADRIVNAAADARLRAMLPDAARVVIADAEHEILQERDAVRSRFFAAFDAFVAGPTS